MCPPSKAAVIRKRVKRLKDMCRESSTSSSLEHQALGSNQSHLTQALCSPVTIN